MATGALACYARRPPNVAQAYEIFHAMCDVSHILRHANDAAIKARECEWEREGGVGVEQIQRCRRAQAKL